MRKWLRAYSAHKRIGDVLLIRLLPAMSTEPSTPMKTRPSLLTISTCLTQ